MGEISNEELIQFEEKFRSIEYANVTFDYWEFEREYLNTYIEAIKAEKIDSYDINFNNKKRFDSEEIFVEIFGINIGCMCIGDDRIIKLLQSNKILYYILLNYSYGLHTYMNIGFGRKHGKEVIFFNFCNQLWKDKWDKNLKTKFKDTIVKEKVVVSINNTKTTIQNYNTKGDKFGGYLVPISINNLKGISGFNIQKKLKLIDFGVKNIKEEEQLFTKEELKEYNEAILENKNKKVDIERIQKQLEKNGIHITEREAKKLISTANSLIDNIL